MSIICVSILIGSLLLLVHGLFSLYVMLYAWDHEEHAEAPAPTSFLPPQLSFAVLLPARYEEQVIFQTICSIAKANYPAHLLEIVVICAEDDLGTIQEAHRAIRSLAELGVPPVRLQTFSSGPINKPRALNVGFRSTNNHVVTIFDAEDDVSSDIFNVVNTLMLQERCGIVQAGVQLMNYDEHWFSIHNALEYYFHFKSRLLYFARSGMVPLGGNTAFIRRDLVERIGGWDEDCLTEDADIGLRLSALGEATRIVYAPRYVTREETPADTASLFRQRTRWHQGFLQVLSKGQWWSLPRLGQRLLALYVLSYPIVQAILTGLWPLAAMGWFWFKVPVIVAMASWLPIYVLAFHLLATAIGAWAFTREYGLQLRLSLPLRMAVTFLPYHLLMGFAAMRALYRQLRQCRNWEKTSHIGAHRPASAATEKLSEAVACEHSLPATWERSL
jgi:cellulose synthase/poly-beta-1,6-N-acetylglucosamine synthase-like glycosyltransferase